MPTDDDRLLYRVLMEAWHRTSVATNAKGPEIRTAFELWLRGSGTGQTLADLRLWEQLRGMEDEERAKFKALLADILE